MTLHLIKLSVGSEDVEGLARWQAQARTKGRRVYHTTRMMPRRRAELLAGGSIYWVIKGLVASRQRLLGIERTSYADGSLATLLLLDPAHVRVVPTPHRPFQGWRYLEGADAPADLDELGGAVADMPPELLAELRQLGLL